MSLPALAIVGTGRMGKAVAERAAAQGWPVVASIGSRSNGTTGEIRPAVLNGARVAIEFTGPAAAAANVRALLAAGCAVVCGTTGWDEELHAVANEVRAHGGTLFHAANFSIGAALLAALAERASSLSARHPEFERHIVEIHHSAKLDAPSGTAKMLAAAMARGAEAPVPITSVRVGAVPGTHTVILDASFEQVRIEHAVRDRRVFADGALAAAKWVLGRQGIFGMQDLLNSEEGRG